MLRFGVFDSLKAELAGPEGQLSPVSRMLCGLCAGVAEATLVVTFIETLKVRLISDQKRRKPRFRGLVHAATTIVREEVRTDLARLAEGSHCIFIRDWQESTKDWGPP